MALMDTCVTLAVLTVAACAEVLSVELCDLSPLHTMQAIRPDILVLGFCEHVT